jgi:hypothetical protein
MTVSKNRIDHIYFDVAYTYHPTRYDKIGKDGIYIKSVTPIDVVHIKPRKKAIKKK